MQAVVRNLWNCLCNSLRAAQVHQYRQHRCSAELVSTVLRCRRRGNISLCFLYYLRLAHSAALKASATSVIPEEVIEKGTPAKPVLGSAQALKVGTFLVRLCFESSMLGTCACDVGEQQELPAALLLAGHPSDARCSPRPPFVCAHRDRKQALHNEAWAPLTVQETQRAVLSHSQQTRRGLCTVLVPPLSH